MIIKIEGRRREGKSTVVNAILPVLEGLGFTVSVKDYAHSKPKELRGKDHPVLIMTVDTSEDHLWRNL